MKCSFLAVLPLLWAASACGPKGAQPEAQSRTSSQRQMAVHFDAAEALRQAVIDGELDRAQGAARTLEGLGADLDRPEPWRPFMADLKQAAAGARLSGTIPEVASALGEVALACGTCHMALDDGPREQAASLREPGWSSDDVMRRHAWAAEALWLGLVTPSDQAWSRGMQALDEAPLLSSTADHSHQGPDLVAIESRLRAIATQADAATDPAQRASLYGRFVATCAACHLQHR